MTSGSRTWIRRALVVGVVLFGALLRVDAIAQTYGRTHGPGWIRALEQAGATTRPLRPRAFEWNPSPDYPHRDSPASHYRSDPYTYLLRAREMRSFYGASRREPLFPYVTRLWLRVLRQQDVAVSFASAFFSILAIFAIYLLGSAAFSSGVGLAAAFLFAIEYDVVTWGIGGWRDDAFTAAVAVVTWMVVRFLRVPSRVNAFALGCAGSLSCLVRITALSFVVPAFVLILAATSVPWHDRVKALGIAVVTWLVVVSPFLINCWRAYGDPFYAINVHADVYREAEGQVVASSQTARQYLSKELQAHPVRTVDTVLLGLTQYPFTNKWTGFNVWVPSSGKWLSYAALAGLLLWTASPIGRVLLVILIASLVPYAFTWRVIADWRFTEHAYPFLLIAACLPPAAAIRLAAAWRGRPESHLVPTRRAAVWAVTVCCALALAWWLHSRGFPVRVFEETLRAHESATIQAGDRDAPFFAGWPRVEVNGNVTVRLAAGRRATLQVPLPVNATYDAFVRLDPSLGPAAADAEGGPVRILMNGHFIASCQPGGTPERIGMCRFTIPSTAVRVGVNRLTFDHERAEGFRLWYLRLQVVP